MARGGQPEKEGKEKSVGSGWATREGGEGGKCRLGAAGRVDGKGRRSVAGSAGERGYGVTGWGLRGSGAESAGRNRQRGRASGRWWRLPSMPEGRANGATLQRRAHVVVRGAGVRVRVGGRA